MTLRVVFIAMLMLLSFTTARADAPLSSTSIYNLPARLIDSDGKSRSLDMYRGRPVLITMFYGSCPMACPLIIDTLRATERALPSAERQRVRILMISIDPARDTPEALHALADRRHVDATRWTLARTDDSTVRKIAALLNVQYRKLPNGEFNHTSVITLLSPSGEIVARSEQLGAADSNVVAELREMQLPRD